MQKQPLKIVADANIPFLQELFGRRAKLTIKPAKLIKPHDLDLKNADVLLVRTRTKVDQDLLANTNISLVGSMTAGTDHIDKRWLEQQGIKWCHAPGCNATSVAEYVVCCIAALQQQALLKQKTPTAAVIGVGQVGKAVARKLQILGFRVLSHDPWRADAEPGFNSLPLRTLATADLVCVHTALTTKNRYPTWHMLGQKFLSAMRPDSVLLNASRGEIINQDLMFKFSKNLLCLDVWEQEPNINSQLLAKSKIATPHIAGYSLEAKLRASLMVYEEVRKFFDLPTANLSANSLPRMTTSIPSSPACSHNWQQVVLNTFNPFDYTVKLKELKGEGFEKLRNNLPLRREFAAYRIIGKLRNPETVRLLQTLGFKW